MTAAEPEGEREGERGAAREQLPALAERRTQLLAWYRRAHRDLPWRRTRDPYAIWVSEIMLQQTRVETVLAYYDRFLARFPDLFALAAAPLDDVLAAWSGLGYYRRARFLKSAAELLARDAGGRFPRDVAAAVLLPGIGRSTAGAIVSIAYGTRAAVLDGNVKRVLARLAGLAELDGAPLEKRAWPLAEALVDCDAPGDVNQSLMELGATVCLPFAAARCEECPWRDGCRARAAGTVESLPQSRPRAALREETWLVAVVRRGSRFLLRRRPPTGLLHDLFELPAFESGSAAPDEAQCRRLLARALAAQFGGAPQIGDELLLHRQVISNRRVALRAFAVTLDTRPRPPARFATAAELRELAITTATRKIVARLRAEATRTAALSGPARARTSKRPPPPAAAS
ncbi:MAG: A/G-specific adenine glycosylase [Planctomycetes bacterium]|nr:A/G-specific adenine glycosylase [Planctomycetota bacterium]